MRVVVTRPDIAGRQTAERLRGLGHETVLMPLAKAVHHTDAARKALAKDPWAIAITSAEAARVLASLGDDIRPHLHTPIFTVGSSSAKAASDAGFGNVSASSSDGTALADLIHGQLGGQETDGKPLLYLAGQPRASSFEARLRALGMPFAICECYSMQPVAWGEAALVELLHQPTVDVVLFYSAQTARQFFANPVFRNQPDLLAAARFLCLSENIAESLPPSHRAKAAVASRTDEDHLLALL
ncbi:MAG: uroporphyrinogen-III synthase [Allorhizobium sp.]